MATRPLRAYAALVASPPSVTDTFHTVAEIAQWYERTLEGIARVWLLGVREEGDLGRSSWGHRIRAGVV
ncbi:MAG: hypothetical protein Q7S65_03355, partial [Nanoarchaeota archaeon]|nr:hypothetical protein [Nanoarchaeota archaeon]